MNFRLFSYLISAFFILTSVFFCVFVLKWPRFPSGEKVLSEISSVRLDISLREDAYGIFCGRVNLDTDELREVQEKIDQGDEFWRLDPLMVAQVESIIYGFDIEDQFVLKEEGTKSQKAVEAVHLGRKYRLILSQPIKIGEGGIWTIIKIDKVD